MYDIINKLNVKCQYRYDYSNSSLNESIQCIFVKHFKEKYFVDDLSLGKLDLENDKWSYYCRISCRI